MKNVIRKKITSSLIITLEMEGQVKGIALGYSVLFYTAYFGKLIIVYHLHSLCI